MVTIEDIIGKIRQMLDKVTERARTEQDTRIYYLFECDSAEMISVKIDTVPRWPESAGDEATPDAIDRNFFVYMEPPTNATYTMPRGGVCYRQTLLRMYFCAFPNEAAPTFSKGDTEFSQNDQTGNWGTEWENGKATREDRVSAALLDDTERFLVRPFIQELRRSDMGKRYPELYNSIRLDYFPASRFDAGEVSIRIEFPWVETLCAKDYA
jgi:hypothetical protein